MKQKLSRSQNETEISQGSKMKRKLNRSQNEMEITPNETEVTHPLDC